MYMKPTGKRILVKPILEEKKAGLILTTQDNSKPFKAIVVSQGQQSEITVKEGDLVLVMSYSGLRLENADNKDEPLLLLNDAEILGVL